jgi:hypothetical protein
MELKFVSMIDCDCNATLSDVAILKYWKNISTKIELLNQMKVNYKYHVFICCL